MEYSQNEIYALQYQEMNKRMNEWMNKRITDKKMNNSEDLKEE